MADTSGKKPAGYGHDNKGKAGGENTGAGKPGVAHTAPVDKVAGKSNGSKTVKFTLDGKEVTRSRRNDLASRQAPGNRNPTSVLSPEPGYRADGNCRACMVEIEGERVLAASCIRKPAEGMKVKAAVGPRQDRAQNDLRSSGQPTSPSARPRTIRSRNSGIGPTRWASTSAVSPSARKCRRPTAVMSRWRSISTRASSAISVSAPAVKCRSTT